jgi:hypothetical protein
MSASLGLWGGAVELPLAALGPARRLDRALARHRVVAERQFDRLRALDFVAQALSRDPQSLTTMPTSSVSHY